jgi:hypothetical protein
MICHAFQHIFGNYVKDYKNILLIGNKNTSLKVKDIIMSDDLNYNIINYAAKDAKISSIYDIPNVKKTLKLDDNYDLISIFTNNDEIDSKSIDLFSTINSSATLLVTNKMISNVDISQKTIIPIVYDINLIIPKRLLNKYKILPLINLDYNFNTSHIDLGDNITFYVTRVSNNKVTMSYLKFFICNNGLYTILNCSKFSPNFSESFEDPRLFIINNKIYLMYVKIENYTPGIHTCLRLNIAELKIENDTVEVVNNFIPQYGLNKLTGPEKNWMFWGMNDKIHCAYYPTKLIEFDDFNSEGRELPEVIIPEKYKELAKGLRGSTCGLVEGNKITTIVHNSKYELFKLIYQYNGNGNYEICMIEEIKLVDFGFIYACGLSRDRDGTLKLTGGINDTRGIQLNI